MNEIREERLWEDYQKMQDLQKRSVLLEIEPIGDLPPQKYHIVYRCKSRIGPEINAISEEHHAYIDIPDDYPFEPPIVYMDEPIFHPNITSISSLPEYRKQMEALKAKTRNSQDLARLERDLREADFYKVVVCLDILKKAWASRISLAMVCLKLGEMLQHRTISLDDPLNIEAARWYRANWDGKPLDNRALLKEDAHQALAIAQDIVIKPDNNRDITIHSVDES